jgi:hypothetical protein
MSLGRYALSRPIRVHLKNFIPKIHFMQKILLFTVLFYLASAMCQLRAQSIDNKKWKSYITAPINDTAFFNIYQDSSFINNGNGQVMVRFHSKINGDTLSFVDYGTEEQGCPDIKGIYKINVAGDAFTLTLINDECAGRSQALAGRKWVEAKK